MKVISAAGSPAETIPAPDDVPPPPADACDKVPALLDTVPPITRFTEGGFGYVLAENKIPYVGGEKAGLRKLRGVLQKVEQFCRSNPATPLPDSTCLSPYISHGTLSVKLFHSRLRETLEKHSCIEAVVALTYQLYQR